MSIGPTQNLLKIADEVRLKLSKPRGSRFRVICVVEYKSQGTDEFQHCFGSNEESSGLVPGVCAERAAFTQLRIIDEQAKVSQIVISTDSEGFISPGALCREYMAEHFDILKNNIPIHLANCKKDTRTVYLKDLWFCQNIFADVARWDTKPKVKSVLEAYLSSNPMECLEIPNTNCDGVVPIGGPPLQNCNTNCNVASNEGIANGIIAEGKGANREGANGGIGNGGTATDKKPSLYLECWNRIKQTFLSDQTDTIETDLIERFVQVSEWQFRKIEHYTHADAGDSNCSSAKQARVPDSFCKPLDSISKPLASLTHTWKPHSVKESELCHAHYYVAGLEFKSGKRIFAKQLQAIEYPASVCAVCKLSTLLDEIDTEADPPMTLIQMDQRGICHAPFGAARAYLAESGMATHVHTWVHCTDEVLPEAYLDEVNRYGQSHYAKSEDSKPESALTLHRVPQEFLFCANATCKIDWENL